MGIECEKLERHHKYTQDIRQIILLIQRLMDWLIIKLIIALISEELIITHI